MTSFPPPPRWLLLICTAVVVCGCVVMIAGAWRIGVSVDEGFHVVRLQNLLDLHWYLLDDDFDGSAPGAWVTDQWVYGPATSLFLHALNVIAGNEPLNGVSETPASYVVRHEGVVFIGLVGVVASAALAKQLLGTWRWGLVTAAILMCLPAWPGHAMFNVKDIPAGSGYTLVTLGCVIALQANRSNARLRIAACSLLAVGVIVAVGTRPAMWTGLGATIGLACLWSLRRQPATTVRSWWRCSDLALAVVASAVVLSALYPQVFLHPFEWMLSSASESGSYGGDRGSRGYLFVMVAATIPGALLLMGMVEFGAAGIDVARGRRRSHVSIGWVLVIMQTFLLPLLGIIVSSPLTGGLRHVLFALPTGAVLLALAFAFALRTPGRAGRAVKGSFIAVGLVVPMVVQVQLFPFSYNYAAEIVDAVGLDVPADYWRTSYRDLSTSVPSGEFVVCSPAVSPDNRVMRRMDPGGQSLVDLSNDCRTAPGSVIAPYLGAVQAVPTVEPTFIALQQAPLDPATGCKELGRRTTNRYFTVQYLSVALRCPLVLPEEEDLVDFDGQGQGADVLLGGWSAAGGDPWVSARQAASLGLRLPDAAEGHRVLVVGSADGPVAFRVNNTPVDALETSNGWWLRAGSATVGDPRNLVVTVVPTDTFRLSRIEVRPQGP